MMGRRCIVPIVVCAVLATLGDLATAAELGRRGPGDVMVTHDFARNLADSGAVDLALAFNGLDWDVGGQSYSDEAFVPEAGWSAVINDLFDLRAALRYAGAEDDPDTDAEGNNRYDPSLDLVRFGVGGRVWMRGSSDFMPFAGAMLNYYWLDGDELDDIDGAVGLSGELGLATRVSDNFLVTLSFQMETFLADPEADVPAPTAQDANREITEDISLTGVGVGIGIALLY